MAAHRTTPSSSAPASAESAPRSSSPNPASRTSSSSNAVTGSAEPGVTTPIPVRRAISRRCSTPTRSPRTRTGHGHTHRPVRSAHTSRRWSTTSICAAGSSSAWRSTDCPSTRRPASGPSRRPDANLCGPAPWCWPPGRSPTTSSPTSAVWTPTRDTRSTVPVGITTTISPASGWPSSAPVPSAVQIVPELVKQAEFVKVFQRTPGWVVPRMDIATPEAAKTLFAKVPAAQDLARQAAVLGPRSHRHRAGLGHPADRPGPAARQGPPAQAGQGSVAAQATHSRFHAGLQAHADLQ